MEGQKREVERRSTASRHNKEEGGLVRGRKRRGGGYSHQPLQVSGVKKNRKRGSTKERKKKKRLSQGYETNA